MIPVGNLFIIVVSGSIWPDGELSLLFTHMNSEFQPVSGCRFSSASGCSFSSYEIDHVWRDLGTHKKVDDECISIIIMTHEAPTQSSSPWMHVADGLVCFKFVWFSWGGPPEANTWHLLPMYHPKVQKWKKIQVYKVMILPFLCLSGYCLPVLIFLCTCRVGWGQFNG